MLVSVKMSSKFAELEVRVDGRNGPLASPVPSTLEIVLAVVRRRRLDDETFALTVLDEGGVRATYFIDVLMPPDDELAGRRLWDHIVLHGQGDEWHWREGKWANIYA